MRCSVFALLVSFTTVAFTPCRLPAQISNELKAHLILSTVQFGFEQLRISFVTSGPKPGPTGGTIIISEPVDEWHLYKTTLLVESTVSNENRWRTHFLSMKLPVEVSYYISFSSVEKNLRRGVGREIIVDLPVIKPKVTPKFDKAIYVDSFVPKIIVADRTEGQSKIELRDEINKSYKQLADAQVESNMAEAKTYVRRELQKHIQNILNRVAPKNKYKVRVE